MLSQNELMKLSLEEKREVVRALLRNAFDAPRSFPLSHAQEQLWFMDKLHPGSPVYNIPLYVPFQGRMDAASLKRALETLTARHDMLRARFGMGADDQPVQIVEPPGEVRLEFEDLSMQPESLRQETLGRLLNEEVRRPFDLSAGACIRYKLFRLETANHLLTVTMHHIIADAWSLGVFVRELNALYAAYRAGQRTSPLAPLHVEYSDYARWQRVHLKGLRLSKLVDYWTRQLAGAPHVLRLPTDHPRPRDQTFRGTVVGFVLDDALSEALIALSRQHGVTVFMVMLACYCALLYRYTGQEDILVGAPVANRGHPELEPIIGIFVNTLILRSRPRDTLPFLELLKEVQAMSLAAFEHQALPFPKLVETLNVERAPGYPPLYQVVFNFQNASLIDSEAPSAEGETLHEGTFPFVHSNTAKVDLNLTVTHNGSRLSGGFEYSTDLFDAATIDTMVTHYRRIAEQVVAHPTMTLIEIPLEPGAGAEAVAGTGIEQARSPLFEVGEFNFDSM